MTNTKLSSCEGEIVVRYQPVKKKKITGRLLSNIDQFRIWLDFINWINRNWGKYPY